MGFTASHANAQKPPLQTIEVGVPVSPLRMAKVKVTERGVELDGWWVDVTPFSSRACDVYCLWECYGRPWAPDCIDGGSCGLGGSRWYFGDGYLNPFTEDDVLDAGSGPLSVLDGGFYWCPPAGSGQVFLLYLWNSTGDVNACDPSAAGDLGGVVFDFGDLPAGCPFYYFCDADVAPLGIDFPGSLIRSHTLAMLRSYDGTGGELATENCQFMLWGAPNNTGTGYVPPPGAVGSQYARALDDDDTPDGTFDPLTECADYAFNVCPSPLGKMVAYGTGACGGPCPADFNRDGFVSGDDFDQYVAAFVLGVSEADFNCDGFVSGDDFDAFEIAFIEGCG